MKKTLLLLPLLIIAQAFGIYAQDGGQPIEGTDAFKYQKDADGRDCYVYDRYVFKTVSSQGNGVYINVYQNSSGNSTAKVCETGLTKPYLVVKDSDSQFFNGLVGDKLIIDDGTGPDTRKLTVVDLPTKKTVFTATVHETGKITGKRFLMFSEPSKTKRPLGECSQAKEWRNSGFSIGWVRQAKLDLRTMKKSVGKISCAAFQ